MSHEVKTIFWGVRGSVPACSPDIVGYGGNTTCIEIESGNESLIIDCGSGLIGLGQKLLSVNRTHVDILLTHYHMDHIIGIPFLPLCYNPHADVRFHAPNLMGGVTLEGVMAKAIEPPVFPIDRSAMAGMKIHPFEIGDGWQSRCGASVKSFRLNHPGDASGFRIEWHGKTIALVSDYEHGNDALTQEAKAAAAGCDLLIYDAMYLKDEYPNHVGWGHSTPEEGIAFARDVGAKFSLFTHHAVTRSDAALDRLCEALATPDAPFRFAKEQEIIHL